MRSFPWASLVVGIGDDGFPIYDRSYDDQDLRDVNKMHFGNGVARGWGNEMFVTASGSSMVVTVETGAVEVEGAQGFCDGEQLEIRSGDSKPRIDTIVARYDKNIDTRNVYLAVVEGTPSDNPVHPQLTREDDIWEIGLCDVHVAANAVAISQNEITSTIQDTSRCGYSGLKISADMALTFYPIGALYLSSVSTSPAELFGGTWESFGLNRVLRSAKDTNTGGADSVTLTISQIPAHSHTEWINSTASEGQSNIGLASNSTVFKDRAIVTSGTGIGMKTGNTGGGGAFSNIPAYQNCYVWKRVA